MPTCAHLRGNTDVGLADPVAGAEAKSDAEAEE